MALIDRSALLAGAAAAAVGWGCVAGPVFLLWVATPYAGDGLAAVPRTSAAIWLLGHGGPLRWEGIAGSTTLGVAPLVVTALAAALAFRAAARAAVRAAGIGAVVLGYLSVALPASLLALGGAPRSEPLPDLCWVVLLVLPAAMAGARRNTGAWGLAAGWQALRARGEWLGVWPVRRPDGRLAPRVEQARLLAPYRDVALRAGLAGALSLLCGGGLLLLGSLVVHFGAAGTLAALLAPDAAGRAALLLLCVALVPNAVVWSMGYALGPGFVLGGHVAATGAAALPPIALPLLADAPAPGRSLLGLCALAVPVVAGPVVGWFVAASAVTAPPRGGWAAAGTALAAAGWTGLLAGAAALWSGGSLGSAALARVGPPVGWTALAAFGWTAALALPTVLALRAYAARQELRAAAEHAAPTDEPADEVLSPL
ncbi:cell division protein PerM [Streptacidiphilus rugosus]|uniref:cell division protein PerM n=1 Tax=Streptacidiphilus rugosus TaxID=405783 RepID=UPI00068B4760|nr:DUF6350 family protein [Streptacidiphilus rugosus]